MSNVVIYTDMDSLWDTRRAVMEQMLPETEDWEEHYGKLYKERRLDYFAKPELGITQEGYETAFEQRDLSIFEKAFPSRLLPKVLSIIMDVENFVGKPINVGTFQFTVNLWPFVIPDDLRETISTVLSQSIIYNHTIRLISVPYDRQDALFFKPFTHAFKYDVLGKNGKALMESLVKHPIPGTKFFVPDICQKEPDGKYAADPEEIIQKMSVFLASAITLIPMRHDVYDYRLSK